MLSVDEALQRISDTVLTAAPVPHSLNVVSGMTLAEQIVSTVDSPPFDKAMMDGYAVRVKDCVAQANLQVIEEISAGRTPQHAVGPGQAIRIMTGAPIPDGADAVIQVEQTEFDATQNLVLVFPESPLRAGQNIIPCGESMKCGETILTQGNLLRAQEIAVLAELGHAQVQVYPKPTMSILATGDELVSYDETPGPGQIRNSNALMLSIQAKQAGVEIASQGIARDNREDLRRNIEQGLQADFLCLSGGVSAGNFDLVPSELQAAGVQQIFHKVSMKPGKPIWFGIRPASANHKVCYVFGLPGNPVSSMVCFELFVRHALHCFSGAFKTTALVYAKLTDDFTYNTNRETFFPAIVTTNNGQLCVTPINWKGSSDLRSTTSANASLRIPSGEEIWKSGTLMQALIWRDQNILSTASEG